MTQVQQVYVAHVHSCAHTVCMWSVCMEAGTSDMNICVNETGDVSPWMTSSSSINEAHGRGGETCMWAVRSWPLHVASVHIAGLRARVLCAVFTGVCGGHTGTEYAFVE